MHQVYHSYRFGACSRTILAEYQGLVDELFSLQTLNLSSYHFPELKTKELYCCSRGVPGSKFIAQVMFIVFSLND